MPATEDDGPLFRVLCPACGYVEVGAERLRLVLTGSGPAGPGGSAPARAGTGGPSYSFRCTGCDRTVRRPAGGRIVELLAAAGVRAVRVHVS